MKKMSKPRNPSLVRLGNSIRQRRERLGLSQEALSLEAEIHRTYLSQLELGLRNPSYTVLLRLANALHMPLQELLPEGDDRHGADTDR